MNRDLLLLFLLMEVQQQSFALVLAGFHLLCHPQTILAHLLYNFSFCLKLMCINIALYTGYNKEIKYTKQPLIYFPKLKQFTIFCIKTFLKYTILILRYCHGTVRGEVEQQQYFFNFPARHIILSSDYCQNWLSHLQTHTGFVVHHAQRTRLFNFPAKTLSNVKRKRKYQYFTKSENKLLHTKRG